MYTSSVNKSARPRFVAVVPSAASVGGIAKVLDYAVHAQRSGYDVIFSTISEVCGTETLFEKPYFREFGANIRIQKFSEIDIFSDDLVFFSLPSNHKNILKKYGSEISQSGQLIHLVQNVRHTNIFFETGYSLRLLSKPMIRICITGQVHEEILPWLEDQQDVHLIKHGFDFDFFNKKPEINQPFSITYNRFKGELGDEIVKAARDAGLRFSVNVIDKNVSWEDLSSSYKNSTVFLATPLKEEGLYLPALEAMAAGCIVLSPDAIGNRFYTRFGHNTLETSFNDVDSYVDALKYIYESWDTVSYSYRQHAYESAKGMSLDVEFHQFRDLLLKYKNARNP